MYSAGAVGENTTLIVGYLASNAGMIVSCQIVISSLRQLSMVNVTSSASSGAVGSSAFGVSGASVASGVAAGVQLDISSTNVIIKLISICLRITFSFL